MAIHRSLFIRTTLKRHRGVFSRAEKIEILKKEGKWQEGNSIYGLPKVKGQVKLKKVKAEKVAKTETAETAAPKAT